MAATLRSRIAPARFGMERGVRAPGTAAQAFVVELHELRNVRPENRAHVRMGALHVTQVARVLHRDRPTVGRGATQREVGGRPCPRATRARRRHAR